MIVYKVNTNDREGVPLMGGREDGRISGIDSEGETVASDKSARGAWSTGSGLLKEVVRIARSRGR